MVVVAVVLIININDMSMEMYIISGWCKEKKTMQINLSHDFFACV